MFGSSLAPVICRMDHVLFTLFVFVCAYWCPTHIGFLFCFSSSYVPYVTSFSGLFIFDCPFGILYRFTILDLQTLFCAAIKLSYAGHLFTENVYYFYVCLVELISSWRHILMIYCSLIIGSKDKAINQTTYMVPYYKIPWTRVGLLIHDSNNSCSFLFVYCKQTSSILFLILYIFNCST